MVFIVQVSANTDGSLRKMRDGEGGREGRKEGRSLELVFFITCVR